MIRSMFNNVLWKMVIDDNELTKISKQAYEYERSEGDCFSRPVVISHRDKRSPCKFAQLKFLYLLKLLFGYNELINIEICCSPLVGFILWPSV